MRIWEETSYQLELRQANPVVVNMEWKNLSLRKEPEYLLTFDPDLELKFATISSPIRVAVIREEGERSIVILSILKNWNLYRLFQLH